MSIFSYIDIIVENNRKIVFDKYPAGVYIMTRWRYPYGVYYRIFRRNIYGREKT